MARTSWVGLLAGAALVLSTGCTTPNGPGTRVMTPPTPTPAPKFGGGSSSPTNTLPQPNLPPINNSQTRIGSPAAQPGLPTSANPKLKPYDPSTGAPIATTQSNFDSSPRNLGNGQPINAPMNSLANSATPRQEMQALPNMLPTGSSFPNSATAFPAPVTTPAMPTPPFPQQPAMPSTNLQPPPSPAASFPGATTPTAPNLTPTNLGRSNIYPAGGVNP